MYIYVVGHTISPSFLFRVRSNNFENQLNITEKYKKPDRQTAANVWRCHQLEEFPVFSKMS